ncbi:MAG: hypothetical protein PHU81_06050 [Acidobacteriota bacterium]|nr:hypothetical protein [Acidobacteriota bacterium]
MKNSFLNPLGYPILLLISLTVILLPASLIAQESQVQKAGIFAEEYPMISDSDMYCSPFIWDQKLPELRIIGSEREEERAMMTDSDTFYINKGREEGIEIGQMFLAIDIGQPFLKLGSLAQKKGKVRVIRLEDHISIGRVEKSCGDISAGNYLIPFEEKMNVIGKDTGYSNNLKPGESLEAQVIYLETDFNIAGSGNWALIDAGEEQGVRPGQQMTVFRQKKAEFPREAIGNIVVVDVQNKTATVKILSCREPIEKGDIVQVK